MTQIHKSTFSKPQWNYVDLSNLSDGSFNTVSIGACPNETFVVKRWSRLPINRLSFLACGLELVWLLSALWCAKQSAVWLNRPLLSPRRLYWSSLCFSWATFTKRGCVTVSVVALHTGIPGESTSTHWPSGATRCNSFWLAPEPDVALQQRRYLQIKT